jgi:hypothetical protein
MKGAPTKPTKKDAEDRAAPADAVPSEQEFRESLVIISVLKKLGHPEGWDFAAARIIPKGSPRASSSWVSQVTSEQHGWLVIPHLPLATSDAPDERELKYKEMHDSIVESHFDLRGAKSRPGTWPGSEAFGMAMDHGMPTAEEMRAIAIESFPKLRAYFPQYFDDTVTLEYITDGPPSEAAVTSPQLRMQDDFNIAIKKARAEVSENAELAKLRNTLLAAKRLATYEVLVRESDLTNRELAQGERLRRAGHLLLTYDRLREVRPDFKDTNDQLTAARRIQKAAYRERQRAKRGLAPAVRGRPRKLHA